MAVGYDTARVRGQAAEGGAFYYVRYRLGGGQRIKSLGLHGHLTPDTARAQAYAVLGKAAVGVDPFPEAPPAAESFGAGVDRYLTQRKPKMKPRSFVEVERHLRKDAKSLATAKLNEIDRRKIAVLLGDRNRWRPFCTERS